MTTPHQDRPHPLPMGVREAERSGIVAASDAAAMQRIEREADEGTRRESFIEYSRRLDNAKRAMRGVTVTGDPDGAVRELVENAQRAFDLVATLENADTVTRLEWFETHGLDVCAMLMDALARFHVEEEADG